MISYLHPGSLRSHHGCRSGQALIEFTLVLFLLAILLFGLIDFSRAIMVKQVLVNVSREGANLTSRGTTLSNALPALVVSANPLLIDQKGYIILSTVTNSNGVNTVTDQLSDGGMTSGHSSKVGQKGGAATLPSSLVLQPNQSVSIAEVFYEYAPVTPIGRMLGTTLPSSLYDVSYF